MNDIPQAFPAMQRFEQYDEDRGKYVEHHLPEGGMTLRDYFAAKAMAAMIVTSAAPALLGTGCESQTAQAAYEMADAMLKARVSE
jgi:hypothetical protein